jgi:hypothetical protein
MSRPAKSLRPAWYQIRPRFLLALACLGGLLFWGYRSVSPPMGRGPAGPAVPPEPFVHTWHDGEVLLLGMGDSVVTGFGAAAGFGFFDRIADVPPGDEIDMTGKCLRRVYPKLRTLNLAENSSSSGDHLRYQIADLPRQPATTRGIIVLSTGGIDLIHDYGASPPRDEALYGATWADGQRYAAAFRTRLDKLLDAIVERFPGGCDIFIATIFDPTDGVGDIERVNSVLRLFKPLPPWPDGLAVHGEFNRHIRAAATARSNVHIVDVYSALLGHGLHCRDKGHPHYHPEDPTYWYFVNLEDPNRRGYDAIRRAFLLEMIRVLEPAQLKTKGSP